MDNGDSQSGSPRNRTQLLDALSNLSPHNFERLLVGVNILRMNLLDGLNELPETFDTEIANLRERYRKTTSMLYA